MRKYQAHGRKSAIVVCVALGLLVLFSCAAQYPLNPKLEVLGKSDLYRSKLHNAENSNSLFLILAFSGGGTRAASLAYGTLEALKKIELSGPVVLSPTGKRPRTLLDEVTVISAVSGGSFTAAYYGLHGEGIFKDFKERFLIRDVQGYLLREFLSPFNWPLLWSPRFGRSDLAQEYYDRILFKGATLSDMETKDGPIVMILATDVIDGVIFPFTRETFSWICSDFNQFPISRAVAASSALPGPLSPVIIRNYAGSCGMKIPEWIPKALETPDPSSRTFQMAVTASTYLDQRKKPYIHLVDGGVSDNLGLRAIIDKVMMHGGIRDALAKSEIKGMRRIAFIIVDAETTDRPSWSIVGDVPGIGAIMEISSTVMVNKYNFETIDLLRRNIRDWQVEDEARLKPLDFYVIHVTFNSLPEKTDRDYFHGIPTTFSLPSDQVDRLREVAARLLAASPEFQRLFKDMGGNMLGPAIPAPTGKDG